MKTRFAPSPTGYLHIGNARTALFCALLARKMKGLFLLRLDDTDRVRSKSEYAVALKEDLAWLGLRYDDDFTQTSQMEKGRYEKAFQHLREAGLIYPCYETKEELDKKRKRLRARGKPPLYDRASLSLSDDALRDFEAQGRKPHWRFKLSGKKKVWDDLVRGQQTIDTKNLSDPIIRREDGSFLYSLPSVVDDIDYGITHIVRGEDHVTNCATQIELFEALGAKPPYFAHHSLVVMGEEVSQKASWKTEKTDERASQKAGERISAKASERTGAKAGERISAKAGERTGAKAGATLSKRFESCSLRQLRCGEGFEFEAMAINNFLLGFGVSEHIPLQYGLDEMVNRFDMNKLTRAPLRFDMSQLKRLNEKILHKMSFSSVQARLEGLSVLCDEAFWEDMKGNLKCLKDIKPIYDMVFGEVVPVVRQEDRDFLEQALSCLPPDPTDRQDKKNEESGKSWRAKESEEAGKGEESEEGEVWDSMKDAVWADWTKRLKAMTGRTGKGLFMPLRLALTAGAYGPEMKHLLWRIGHKKASLRLKGQKA